jgi:iron complex outermembrane receptor protein
MTVHRSVAPAPESPRISISVLSLANRSVANRARMGRALRWVPWACALAASSAGAQTAPTPATSTSLPETVVSASRFAETYASQPQGVSVLTAEDIRASGATTVNEAIMRLLGVVGRQDLYGGGDYALDLRGFGTTADNNQVVVLDGIRLNEADLGGTRLAGIPIDAVERIEVLRGNGAVLYGEGATGGVIVITTQAGAGKARRSGASVQLGAGSLGLREARASATLAAGGFSIDAAAQKRDSDNHRDNFRSETDGGNLTAQWSNDTLRIGARYGEDRLSTGLPGSLTAAQYAANPRQTTKPNDRASLSNQRSGVFAEAMLGEWQLAFDAGWREKSLRSTQSGFSYDYDVEATTYGARARREARWGELRNALVIGADAGEWKRHVMGAFGSRAEQTTHAWYLKDDLTFATGTRLSAGWRTESLDKSLVDSTTTSTLRGSVHAWDVGLSHPVTRALTAWGRVGTSYRLANVDEFSFTDPAVVIRPQTSRDLEAGTRWAQGPFKVEARLYRSLLTDEIGYDPTADGPYGAGSGANINFDPTRRQGLELDGSWAAARDLTLRANLAWRQSVFRAGKYAGKDVPLAPRQTVSLRADWVPAERQRVTGGVNWVSSQHPDFANQCRMPAYTTVDLRYAYQWRQVELALGINNLFDRNYYSRAFSCSGGVTSGIYPEAGRTVNATLRVSF